MVVLFNGGAVGDNVELARQIPNEDENIIVIFEDGKSLPPRQGILAMEVSDFHPVSARNWILVTNGAPYGLFLPVLQTLMKHGIPVSAGEVSEEGFHKTFHYLGIR